MVLAELGSKISRALQQMSNATLIDEAVLNACLKEIGNALMQADVKVDLVIGLRGNIKKRVNMEEMAAGLNKRKIIEKAVFDELCGLLDAGTEGAKFSLKKGKPNVVMFVGLQGSGKTTTCTKYAYHYKKEGYKPALVCADTFRAGAFDQLKQNATKAGCPFYGSYTVTDPATIAKQGVDRFKEDGRDLVIVDTSGRHKQEAALFEEMREVSEAVRPDLIIFVMDGSIGQAAYDQAKAFKDMVEVGAVILTKLDGHAKGGGALSAVSATKSPVIFIGTGEHIDEFEEFETKRFVSRLLGKGDWESFINKISDVIPEDKQPELLENIAKGQFSMRILYDQFQNILKMGPMSQVMSMIPGFSNAIFPKGHDKDSQSKIKRYMTIMDSMTAKELDETNIKELSKPARLERLARGSGRHKLEVEGLLEEYRRLSKVFSSALKGMKIPKNMKGDMPVNPRKMQEQLQQMSKVLPSSVLKQIGGVNALQGLMKTMGEKR
ncbi:unnamed protein product [Ostreobium quekettii]|uniref:Signal recognition particle 54 kDa protein n=1 Tax=Ostreobium quekettii TaxID=121088 RepID=A0A8S1IVP4_9CHLO|nr:unnamed protein product [Ostreobium quekettii]|eukprot:evm.model.scf_209.6 EVM.evm.TU.scf_209.6   scf_209:28016-32560(+)